MNTRGASIDLTDMSACGVYFVTRADIDTLGNAAERDDFNVHRISLAGCRERDTLARRMAADLSLPPDEDHSWANLVDYLQDMDGLPSRGHITLFTAPEEWLQSDPDSFDATLDALEETAAIWANEGVAFFVFLPQDEAAAVSTAAS